MVHIERIKIIGYDNLPSSQVLKKDFEYECSDLNLFVGNQGCGKSSLLKLLQRNKGLELTLEDNVVKNGVQSFYFDTEKDNPRVKDINNYSNPDGTNRGIGVGAALSSMFKSHGEVLEQFIIEPLLKAKDSVILLDEPESGLSITNQFRLIEAIKTSVNNNCQLFIATHCYPLIESCDYVLSLEHWSTMSGKQFINKIIG